MSFLDWLFGDREPSALESVADQERKRFWAVQHALDGPYGDNATNPALYGSHAYNATLGQMRDPLLRRQFKATTPSGLAEKSRSTRPIPPTQFSGSPTETVTAYLKDAPLDSIFLETRVPFDLPQETPFSGH